MTASFGSRVRAWLPQIRLAFTPRYLSMGLLWAWMNVAWNTESLAPARLGIRILSMPAWLPSATVVVITLFAVAALAPRARQLPAGLVAVATALMTLGTALTLAYRGDSAAITGVLGAVTGVSSGLLIVASCSALSTLETERLELTLPACAVVSAALSFAVPSLGFWPAAVCSCAAPLLAGACALWAMRTPAPGAPDDVPASLGAESAATHSSGTVSASDRATVRSVLLASLTNFAAYTAICFLEVSLPLVWVAASDPWVYLLTSAMAIALILLVIGHSVRVDAQGIYRWVMPLLTCAIAFKLADVQALGILAYLISRTCSMMVEILLGLYFITLAHRGRIGACTAGGLYMGTCQLGVLVGNALVLTPAGADPTRWGLWCALGCVCLLALASVMLPWLSDAPRRAASADSAPPTLPHEAADASPDSALDAACSRLATARGLSARETEVLGYLARGRSQPYIREELMLSKNTVSSHVQHIYAKLGVHSKQELIDLVEHDNAQL